MSLCLEVLTVPWRVFFFSSLHLFTLRLLSFGSSKPQNLQERASVWNDKSTEFMSPFNHSLQRERGCETNLKASKALSYSNTNSLIGSLIVSNNCHAVMHIQFLQTHWGNLRNVLEYILLDLCKKFRWFSSSKMSETDRKTEYAIESSFFNWP